MAGESPTDWLSFAEYLGLAGDEISRMDEEAGQRAQGLETEASQRLAVAGQEAQRTGQALSATGSYQDYLTAQQQAKKARAAMGAKTGNIYEDAVRESQGRKQDFGMGDRLAAQEDAWSKRAQAWNQQKRDSMAAYTQQQKADAAALETRKASDREKKRALGYSDDDGAAYRDWSDSVNRSRDAYGGIGGSAYFGGKPVKG